MVPFLMPISCLFRIPRCWDEFVSSLKDICSKVADAFRSIGHAVRIFAQKVRNEPFLIFIPCIFQVIYRLFFKENDQWTLETLRMKIPESEVPEWAKAGVDESEVDVTSRYQRELQLTL